eukprot:12578656-Alexandrium_andersonii.AAC.1
MGVTEGATGISSRGELLPAGRAATTAGGGRAARGAVHGSPGEAALRSGGTDAARAVRSRPTPAPLQ